MANEHMNLEPLSSIEALKNPPQAELHQYRTGRQEHILAALALLLGPETDHHMRLRATRRLSRQGPPVLPLLLTTLNSYPEITSPPWPWWPPQYEHCSRLLLQLCQGTHIQLEALLQHPLVSQPIGPVLWTSIIEAAGLTLHSGQEVLLRKGLTAPWSTTRYAAAMALANLADKSPLKQATLQVLHTCQCEEETIPVRLAAACALLRSEDSSGLEVLMKLIDSSAPEEARKAAAFVLATEPPNYLCSFQRERLIQLLIRALQDQNKEIGEHAASALSSIALPATLPLLYPLLDSPRPQVQLATLAALEEMVSQKTMRRALQQHATLVVPLLRSGIPEVRRQASYTLAACGGEYVTAVLGTLLLDNDHPAHLEAIEGLRLLRGVLRQPRRPHVVDWLLSALGQPGEAVQATALDSLTYLAWQARIQGQRKAYTDISHEILRNGTPLQLLTCPSAWVRQRSIELLGALDNLPQALHICLIQLLYSDEDSGVRACVAYTLGQMAARWAIPDLIQTLLDPNQYVAETALNSLGLLASPDDAIIVYILRELAGHAKEHPASPLAQPARALLKKWQKARTKGV